MGWGREAAADPLLFLWAFLSQTDAAAAFEAFMRDCKDTLGSRCRPESSSLRILLAPEAGSRQVEVDVAL